MSPLEFCEAEIERLKKENKFLKDGADISADIFLKTVKKSASEIAYLLDCNKSLAAYVDHYKETLVKIEAAGILVCSPMAREALAKSPFP